MRREVRKCDKEDAANQCAEKPRPTWHDTSALGMTIPIARMALHVEAIRGRSGSMPSALGVIACWPRFSAGTGLPRPLVALSHLHAASDCLLMAAYGFIASILPVWMVLEPRDYLSTI